MAVKTWKTCKGLADERVPTDVTKDSSRKIPTKASQTFNNQMPRQSMFVPSCKDVYSQYADSDTTNV